MERLIEGPDVGADRPWSVARWRWGVTRTLRRIHARIGGWGWVCAVLLMACAATAALAGWQQRGLESLRRSQMATLGQATAAAHVGEAPVLSSKDRLNAFDAFVVDAAAVPQHVQDLFRVAEEHGLTLERGSYESQADAVGGFVRVRMNLPVKGPVESVHAFVRQSLLQQPQLALEAVRFKREGADSEEVQAQLTWVLFARPTGAGQRSVGGTPAGGAR